MSFLLKLHPYTTFLRQTLTIIRKSYPPKRPGIRESEIMVFQAENIRKPEVQKGNIHHGLKIPVNIGGH